MPRLKATTKTSGTTKMFGGRIPDNLARAIKILGVEEKKSVQELLVEALQDILVKYGKKVPKE